jgi:hypothetical protein
MSSFFKKAAASIAEHKEQLIFAGVLVGWCAALVATVPPSKVRELYHSSHDTPSRIDGCPPVLQEPQARP